MDKNYIGAVFTAAALAFYFPSTAWAQKVQPVTADACGSKNIPACDAAVNAPGTNVDKYNAYLARRDANFVAGNYAKVISDNDAMIAILSTMTASKQTAQLKAGLYVLRAHAHYLMDDSKQAKEDIDLAVSTDPDILSRRADPLIPVPSAVDPIQFYALRGEIEQDLGQDQSAAADYAKVIALKPAHPTDDQMGWVVDSYLGLGILAREDGRYQDSIDNLTQAIAINPRAGLYYLNRGWDYVYLTKWSEALQDLNLSLQFPIVGLSNLLAYRLRGEANLRLDNYDNSIADLNVVIADPKIKGSAIPQFRNYSLYKLRGEAYAGKNDFDNAIKDYTQSITLQPTGNKDTYELRGEANFSVQRYNEAIADMNEVVKEGDDEPELYSVLGVSYAGLALQEAKSEASFFSAAQPHAHLALDNINKYLELTKNDPDPAVVEMISKMIPMLNMIVAEPPVGDKNPIPPKWAAPVSPQYKWIDPINPKDLKFKPD